MRPFRRGDTWWIRVPRPDGPATQRSCRTSDKVTAEHVAVFLHHLQRTHEHALLTALADGAVALDAAYVAWAERRLPAFIRALTDGTASSAHPLAPLVERWQAELARRDRPSAPERARYAKQVGTFVEKHPTLADLTRPTIRAWLEALPVGQPNRYRAALSAFCSFLVLEDLLPANPVSGVPARTEAKPRDRHLSVAEAMAFVARFPQPHRAFQALCLVTAGDVGSVLAVRHVDADATARSVHIRGTKRAHRDRVCYLTKSWAPLWESAIAPYLAEARAFTPTAPLFPALTYATVRARFLAEAAAFGLEDYGMKDHRHTWAVQAFKDGLPIHAIARQLGHATPVLALKVYGRHQPVAADYWQDGAEPGRRQAQQ